MFNKDDPQSNPAIVQPQALRLLRIDSSSRKHDSTTRNLTATFIEQLVQQHGNISVVERDVTQGLNFIDDTWVGATFTPVDKRTPVQHQALMQSDELVNELQQADVIVMGVPIYNFSVPASLKAWIDLVARAGVTFRYGENGPVGLLEGKKVYVVLASGGTAIGSNIDFASGYLKHVLGFIGIKDVEIISAERLNANKDAAMQNVKQDIDNAVVQLQKHFSQAA